MSNYYSYWLSPSLLKSYNSSHDRQRITIHTARSNLQTDDKILIVLASSQSVLPHIYTVTSINRNAGTATLTLNDIYNRSIPYTRINTPGMLPREGIWALTEAEFENAINNMGGKYMEEKPLLDYIQSHIRARGYYFDDETLYNYHICLKTRPFVILAGLSGTGKSKLSRLYAEALGHKEHYLRLSVRPNWNDDRYLLGHINTITGEYVTEPAVEFLMDANADSDNLYFFCLDEMNLAHVEYYFSQFLSAMEEEQPEERQIILLGKRAQKQLQNQGKEAAVPTHLPIPTNLFFTGTINVDETTQSISDKVIDRANTLEFFTVDLDKIPPTAPLPDPITLSTSTWQSYQVHTPDLTYRPQIIAISKILNKASLGLGYRVLHEIELYLANSTNLLAPEVAFDLQVKQRILPRVRGAEGIKTMLEELQSFLKSNNLPRSEFRLEEMRSRLRHDGYTSFWR